MATQEMEYVLGTHDEEVARLALQHRVWQTRVHDAWQRAGFAPGQHIVDVGCGPGFASLDLARVVGPNGGVTAIDQSRRFLNLLAQQARQDSLGNISSVEADLNGPLAIDQVFDGAWIRWVLAFVKEPRELLTQLRMRLRPHAPLVIHEYFDNRTWRMSPPHPAMEHFVRVASDNWRRSGGEPNIALSVVPWLEELGFTIAQLKPFVDIVGRDDRAWHWLTAFIDSGRKRLVTTGELTADESDALAGAMHAWDVADPPVRMVTPGVLEIIALR